MYTQEDVRKLFMQRGEIEMELKVRQAQYYGKEAEIPSEMAARVMELQRELMTIDGFFAALSENEAFVIQHHLMEELDWPQTMAMSQYNKQTVDKLRKPGGKKRNAFVGNSHFILSMHQL